MITLHHKRTQQFDIITSDLQGYLNDYFSELFSVIDRLQPLTMNTCEKAASKLTPKAAFSTHVRAILLIKNNIAFCSSATGAMNIAMKPRLPDIDLNKKRDIALMPGTSLVPNRPVFVLWVRNPQLPGQGILTTIDTSLLPGFHHSPHQGPLNDIALVAHNNAISTFSPSLTVTDALPARPVRTAQITGLPLIVNIYGKEWTTENLLFSLVMGAVCGLLTGLACYYILSIHLKPGKAITTAIKQNQFYVVYQPVVNVATMQITGVEVLMRWRHPVVGEVSPDAFINLAEDQNQIVPLTHHLFKLIAQDAPTLQHLLLPGSKLGINIAPTHLLDERFKQDLRNLAASLPANHFHIVLEITERVMLDQEHTIALFDWLHKEGFKIAIDDFGTGHSALIYVDRYAFDVLKIDRAFINAIGAETVTSPVLDAVLTLARRMNLLTIAEGVETPEQADWLRKREVNFMQGYWFSRPLTLAQLTDAHAKPEKYFATL